MLTQEPDPDTFLGKMALRARLVPPYIRGPLVAFALVLTGVCAVMESGPYWLFASAQAVVLDGEHVLILTWALTFLVFLVPIGALIQFLGYRIEQQRLAPKPMGAFPQPDPYYHTPYPPQAGHTSQGYAAYGGAPQGPYGGQQGVTTPQAHNPYSIAQRGPGAQAAPGPSPNGPYPPSEGPTPNG